LQTASTPDTLAAFEMGLVGGRESRALGCNWAFTPIVDIHSNWRNTVIATRAFGNDHDTVIKYAQAFSDGVREGAGDRPIALCMKHFPGDGRDERDQHVVTSYNDCSVAEWDATYRKIWEWGIDAGIESVMVGHIMLPAYSRHLRPGIADADILPATVAPELLTDLLRDDLGFNGVILTDASLMVGLTSALPRERQMVQAITAGCDMILFFRNHDEDFGFVRDAIRSGEITAQRLEDALTRILGLKAKLGLHQRRNDDLVPGVDELEVVGSAEHHAIAARIADQTIALLKDTANTLPLDPAKHRRLRLYCLESAPDFSGVIPEFKRVAIEELTAAGFEVSVFKSLQELSDEGQRPDMQTFISAETQGYADKYDAALILANISDFAQQGALRIKWSMPMGPEVPWYAAEVPTVFVSLNMPNHLIDVPMVKTAINAHTPTAETIQALVGKLTGRSAFRGTHNENVWCGSWDTRR
jgi:beta-N-acetylhexosaminidase